MPAGSDTHLLLRAFVDELARCGVRDACTSPGSRCSPLVLALVRDGRLRCWSHIDERCAGFFAVGAAKAAGQPIAITCTSGTAAANLAPAVIEAWEARVPLVVLTADRPPELREVGAGQAIDQIKLFGSAAKWFFEVGNHEATPERVRWMRMLACRAVWTALDGRPGPGAPELRAARAARAAGRARARSVPTARRRPAVAAAQRARRGLRRRGPRAGDRRARRAPAGRRGGSRRAGARSARRRVRAPRLAAARRSSERRAARRRGAGALRPPAALRIVRGGAAPRPRRPLRRPADVQAAARLARRPAAPTSRSSRSTRRARWHDPSGSLQNVLAADPAATLAATAEHAPSADPAWLQAWRDADARAAAAIDRVLGDALSEPRVARELGARLPAVGDAVRRLVDAGARRRGLHRRPRRCAARALQPRRQRHRRDGVERVRRRRGQRRAGRAADRRRRARTRRRRPARRPPHRPRADDRAAATTTAAGSSSSCRSPASATPSSTTSRPRTASTSRMPLRCTAATTSASRRSRELRDALDRSLDDPRTQIIEVRTDRAENLALHRALAAAATPG